MRQNFKGGWGYFHTNERYSYQQNIYLQYQDMHTRQFYVIGIYNHFPLCLVFVYPPIVRIPELQKKNEWCRGRGNSEEAIGRISYHSIVRVSDFLACVPFLLRNSQKKCCTNKSKTEYICYIVASLCVYIIYLICKSWQQQANCQNGCNLSRNL